MEQINKDGTKEIKLDGIESKSLSDTSQSSIWVEKTTRGYRWGVKLYFEGDPIEFVTKLIKVEDTLKAKYGEKSSS